MQRSFLTSSSSRAQNSDLTFSPRQTGPNRAETRRDTMASKQSELPSFTPSDYIKFFGAGALAATSTHGVRPSFTGIKETRLIMTGCYTNRRRQDKNPSRRWLKRLQHDPRRPHNRSKRRRLITAHRIWSHGSRVPRPRRRQVRRLRVLQEAIHCPCGWS